MLKVAVIGATGKAGNLIAKEARMRGYEVTAVTRPGSISKLEDNYPVIAKDLFDLTTDDLRGFDVVVDAFGTDMSKSGNEYQLVTSVEHLIQVMEPIPETRLFVIGGAGSLFEDETRTHRIYESITPDARAVPYNAYLAYLKLAESKVNYTFMSPAENFDFTGPRTGEYTLGEDVKIVNSVGLSYITYADFAVAMVDEFEARRFVKARFTAISESKYKNDGKNFFSIAMNPFTRRGSYMTVTSMGPGTYGGAQLAISSRRGEVGLRPTFKLIDFAPTHHGRKIPYAVLTRPDELILRTKYGNIHCCFAEEALLYFKGENGLGLRFDKAMERHEIMKPRGDKGWEGVFRNTCSLVFNPLKGKIDMDAKWDWERLCTPIVRGDVLPDENGEFLLSVEEFSHAGHIRDSYPTYEEGLADVRSDWEEFLSHQPDLGSEYEDQRREAAFLTWSHLVSPNGLIKRPLLYMRGSSVASSWQMCEGAVAVKYNLPLAMELLLNMIDNQSEFGQLPDWHDNIKGSMLHIKPPIQGWALKILMEKHDFATEVPRDKLVMLYEGYCRWADWFFKYRDDDHDGLAAYEHGDDAGVDDSAVFRKRPDVEMPELAAFLGLLDEALGDIAKILGKPEEAEAHYARSRASIDKLIKCFWNGERFVGLTNRDHQVVETNSTLMFRPLVLGHRLPDEIIEKSMETLSKEGMYLSPYGIMNVPMNSIDYNRASFSNSSISTSDNLLIITGLYDAGKKDFAKMLAQRYCNGVKVGGSYSYGISGAFQGSWGASGFQIIADVLHNG